MIIGLVAIILMTRIMQMLKHASTEALKPEALESVEVLLQRGAPKKEASSPPAPLFQRPCKPMKFICFA